MGKLVPTKAYGDRTDWACKVQLSSRREDFVSITLEMRGKRSYGGASHLATTWQSVRMEASQSLMETCTASEAGKVLRVAAARS